MEKNQQNLSKSPKNQPTNQIPQTKHHHQKEKNLKTQQSNRNNNNNKTPQPNKTQGYWKCINDYSLYLKKTILVHALNTDISFLQVRY